MTALSTIEDFLLSSDARLIRVIDIYKSVHTFTATFNFDTFSMGNYRNVSYSDCINELNSHPWFEADKNNRNIFKVVL